MKRLILGSALMLSACGATPAVHEAVHVQNESGESAKLPEIDIPYTKFVLPNGLTLLVHEDHKTPVVAVNVWYHVGSKDEVQGKTGFAHLFEHLMFQGSENLKGEFFEPLESAGATDLNGTTNADRTNYFQTVPTSALDLALWMESDRMGHFVGAISQERLDEQRGVVQNEKRQGQNQPYGKVWELIPGNTYPAGHPYSWSTIGSMEDLNAASLDDVKGWFKGYYGAANAVLSVAGDITPDEAYAKVLKYFGDIPAGNAVQRKGTFVAKMTERRELETYDRVPQERVNYVYNVPAYGDEALERLRLASMILGSGKNSRLYKRLVYDEQLATSVYVYVDENEIGSQILVVADARQGVPLAQVEDAIAQEMAKFLDEGPTDDEMTRARMSFFADRVSRLERVGGFGGKSDILARNEVFLGDASAYQRLYKTFATATKADVKAAANEWFGAGVFVLRVRPEATTTVASVGADRSKLPEVGEVPGLALPELQRATLKNGMKVVLAARHDVPLVQLRWVIPAGFASDLGGKPGTAKLAMDIMDEGTKDLSSLELAAELDRLGASLWSSASLDDAGVNMSVLSTNLDAGMGLLAQVVTSPAFAEAEVERRRAQLLAGIEQEKSKPMSMAQRLLGPALFGVGHPYGTPLTGSGTPESVKSITRDDIVAYHQANARPDASTLIVVGDTTMEALLPAIEKAFGDWRTDAKPAKAAVAAVAPTKSRVLFIDKPGAEQSMIVAGNIYGTRAEQDPITAEAMNQVIGGSFMSRINMNLREDKHWSYGARSVLFETRNQQAYAVFAQVQSDKTAESILEIQKEISQYLGDNPITADELQRVKLNTTRKLPGQNETTGRVLGSVDEIVKFNLPDDYFNTYVSKMNGLSKADVSASAKAVIKPGEFVWIVVGDLSKIEAGVRALNLSDTVEVVKQ